MGKTMAGLVLLLVGRIEMQTELQESLETLGGVPPGLFDRTREETPARRVPTLAARQIIKRMSGGEAFSPASLHRQARLGLGVKGPLEELARARAPQEFVCFHDHAATR